MKKFEIPLVSKCLFAHEHFNNNNENILLIFADEESTISAYKQLKFFDTEALPSKAGRFSHQNGFQCSS